MTSHIARARDVLVSVFEALKKSLLGSTKLGMDETRLPVIMRGLGHAKTCWAWSLTRNDISWNGNDPPAVAFFFSETRAGLHAERILEGFSGLLQVDAFGAYNCLTKEDRPDGPIALAYCWAHVRRRFRYIWKTERSRAALEIKRLIDQMYGVEKAIRGEAAAVRLAVRKKEIAPMVSNFFRQIEQVAGNIPEGSNLRKAINYAAKLRSGLELFLTDGRLELDNNAVEREIRKIALLRNASLFAGSVQGAHDWMMMASLIGTCRLNGVEPYAYLNWVFEKMEQKLPLSRYDELLPWNCPVGRQAIAE